MTGITPIEIEYNKENLLTLLAYGEMPDESPYSHKQLAEWCKRFWNQYCEVDAPQEIEDIMPVLADVETQWDLYLANTYSIEELRESNLESVKLPVEWFKNWAAEADT